MDYHAAGLDPVARQGGGRLAVNPGAVVREGVKVNAVDAPEKVKR